MLTKEELIAIGVNPDNMVYPHGEMNVIVQCFGKNEEDGPETTELFPDIYHPRKNSVWSCGCQGDSIAFETEKEKKDWVAHLRDSAERLKIMAYYLSQQAKEIEEGGYPKTTCYYPE